MGIAVAVDGEEKERKEARCTDGLLRALAAKLFCLGLGNSPHQTQAAEATPPASPAPVQKKCGSCGKLVEEYGRGSQGVQLCRPCIRSEDEERLGPFSEEERRGLDLVSKTLDSVSWRFWKPGEQPAQLLDWLYLGDLRDVLNWELLGRKGITAVLNLINWWELTALLPEDIDLHYAFSTQDVLYKEVDSEDRLFYNIVDTGWPASEEFLEKCRSEGRKVIVNCAAGHNRSACMVVCWLHMREKMTLIQAMEHVQQRRGTILSNHGFRHQLVRLALQNGRLGEPSAATCRMSTPASFLTTDGQHLQRIIRSKRTSAKYDIDSETTQAKGQKQPSIATNHRKSFRARRGSISDKVVEGLVSQRKLSMELLACLVHSDKSFKEDYVFTSNPPTVVGSGFSGDVVLCRRKESSFDDINALRCVKRFCHAKMIQDHLQKLKNEAVIYLSLEHPLVARLFDVYENEAETSLVMQYCRGGTLEDVLQKRGAFSEKDFKTHAVQMLRAVAYIHSVGIVHRDIKPRNWVFEADHGRIKLIDFGFSVKNLVASEEDEDGLGSLKGCMGTLGYLAPEVVHDRTDAGYNEKCDIWSLGVVFFELLTADHAFHREAGTCDGYTQEVTLREIEEISTEGLQKLLRRVPEGTRAFLGRMLTKDPVDRLSALELLRDPYLAESRATLATPQSSLSKGEVLRRFKAYGEASAPTRASMLALARAPTRLPWSEFESIRATYDLFDSKNLTGAVNREAWLSVVAPGGSDAQQASEVWERVVGEQESLSYCEFLAALLPLIEDAFEDALPEASSNEDLSPARGGPSSWSHSLPISSFLSLLKTKRTGSVGEMIFDEETPVIDVVRCMIKSHFRWVIVRYHKGNHSFFDYMDINHRLLAKKRGNGRLSSALSDLCRLPVGQVANCSGYCEFVPVGPSTTLREVLQLISGCGSGNSSGHANVHRVPIVSQGGQVMEVFSCLSFLELAMRFPSPRAILASRSASIFDCRNSIMESSVETEDTVISGLHVMDEQQLTICPATSRELSGSMGGVAVIGVISVSDLKWVVHTGNFSILDSSIEDFLAWRTEVARANESQIQRDRGRYKCISVDAQDSLYILATKLLASRLQRIFLSSEEIGRIIGVASSRDILVEIFGELELQSSAINENIVRCCSVTSAGST